jgi:hypothetical protein
MGIRSRTIEQIIVVYSSFWLLLAPSEKIFQDETEAKTEFFDYKKSVALFNRGGNFWAC